MTINVPNHLNLFLEMKPSQIPTTKSGICHGNFRSGNFRRKTVANSHLQHELRIQEKTISCIDF